MKLLFPSHPLNRRSPDPDFESEASAAQAAGFECLFYDLDLLRRGDAPAACAPIEPATIPGLMLIHRGWMMSDELYLQLWSELERKGYSLFTKPAGYAEAHYLPNAYKHINGLTPASAWVVGNSLEAAWDIYQQFKDGPALVKDFVKSAKHRWNEACFIPAKASREHFKQIMASFLEARGDQFNKGIVLRRFHTLVTLQRDLRGQPVHEEYRMFFFGGKLFAATPPLQGEGPFGELAKWTDIANRFESKFISMDVARQEDGAWVIIEVGDGGVSGLPDSIDSKFFYLKLRTFTDECKS